MNQTPQYFNHLTSIENISEISDPTVLSLNISILNQKISFRNIQGSED